jgi:AcrR family transcriptional regulator
MRMMSPRTETSRKILDAALELFSEKGYRGTTTKAIAQRAGVNEVTLFRHFASKENIFFAVIDRETDIKEQIQAIDFEPTEDLAGDLASIGLTASRNMIARAKLMKLVMMEIDRHPDLWQHVSHAPFEALGIFSRYFKKATAKGTVRDVDPEFAALVFFSFFFRSLVTHAFMGEDVMMRMDEDTIGKFTDIFVHGIAQRGG